MRKEEIGKYLVKLQLCEARDREARETGPFGLIKKVGEKNPYKALPEGFSSMELSFMGGDEIEDLCDIAGIKNSIHRSRADIYVNDEGYRFINQKLSSIPIIKNLTRDKIELVCEKLKLDMKPFDEAIEKYWILRENGSIGEEVENSSENSPFNIIREHLSTLIEYFLFDGDEKLEYELKSNKLLFFSKPLNANSWKLVDRENGVDELWNRLKISIKHQGMPSKYPNNKDSERNESIEIWTRYFDEFYVGALSIRI